MKKFILIIPFLFAGCSQGIFDKTELIGLLTASIEYAYMQAQIECLENGPSIEKIGDDWQWTEKVREENIEKGYEMKHNYLSEYKRVMKKD